MGVDLTKDTDATVSHSVSEIQENTAVQNNAKDSMEINTKNTKNSYTTFEGRLNRLAYCIMGLKLLGAYIVVCVIVGLISKVSEELAIVLFGIAGIGAIICNFSLTVRRWHDLNRSGWWTIALFIPWVDLVVGLYLIFAPGTKGANDYGEDPLKS